MSVLGPEVALSRDYLHCIKLPVRVSLFITVNNLWPGFCNVTTSVHSDLSKIMCWPFTVETIVEKRIQWYSSFICSTTFLMRYCYQLSLISQANAHVCK